MDAHTGFDRTAVIRKDRGGRPFVVRDFHPEDRASIEAFYDDFQPKRAAQGLPPETGEQRRQWLTNVLASGIHKLALRDGEIIGHGYITPTRRPGYGEYAIFLREDQRGQGIGTELNRVCVATAKALGFSGLWLTVAPDNRAAIRSYQKAGFAFIPSTIFSIEPEMETIFRS